MKGSFTILYEVNFVMDQYGLKLELPDKFQ
jgi:hypothetical protein